MVLRFLACCLTLVPMAAAGELVLVEDGRPKAVILLEATPTRSAQMGALELQHHIKLITGAELSIERGNVPNDGRFVIQIGDAPAEPGRENHQVKTDGSRIVLSGNDDPDTAVVDYKNPETFPPEGYRGSLYAVYDFLESDCGVRFYGIDDLDIVYRERPTLSVAPRDRSFSPGMDAFRMINFSTHPRHSELKKSITQRQNELWKLRWRMNQFFGRVNHNQYSIYFTHWDRALRPGLAKAFVDKRPWLFAQGYEGKRHNVDPILRNNYPDDPDIPPQLCYSNPETVAYYAREVLTYFKGGNVPGGWLNFSGNEPTDRALLPHYPGQPFFYPIEGGDTGGFCLCERCKERFSETAKDNVSNSKFLFIADVAKTAAETNPTAGVSTLAYIQTLGYPDKVTLPPNVSVQMCLTTYSWWHPVARAKQEAAYRTWLEKEGKNRPLTLWNYLFSTHWDAFYHFGDYKPLPGFYPWETAEFYKRFAADGIRGHFTECDLAYNMLEAYVASRVSFDPATDTDRLIADYFADCYGDAGEAMQEIYRISERFFWDEKRVPPEWLKDRDVFVGPKGVKHPYWGTALNSPDVVWGALGDDVWKRLDGLVKTAQARAKTPAETERVRRFVERIWEPARQGCEEHRANELRKQQPQTALAARKIADANGDPEKVDWNAVPLANSHWTNLQGQKVEATSTLRIAIDGQYLYLRYTDKTRPDPAENNWTDTIELFLRGKSMYPYYQIGALSDGRVESFARDQINDAVRQESWALNGKIDNRPATEGWTFFAALPLNQLPPLAELAINMFRIQPGRRIDALFPTYAGVHEGREFYGNIKVFPLRFEESAFRLHKKGEATDIVDDPAAENQRAAWMHSSQSWAIQCLIPPDMRLSIPMVVRGAVRIEPENDLADGMFRIGTYNTETKKDFTGRVFPLPKLVGKQYQVLELPAHLLDSPGYIYVGGYSNKEVASRIFVDYFEFDVAP